MNTIKDKQRKKDKLQRMLDKGLEKALSKKKRKELFEKILNLPEVTVDSLYPLFREFDDKYKYDYLIDMISDAFYEEEPKEE